jgi:dienelactone hydrolase
VVVYFPGSWASILRSSQELDGMDLLTFVITSGRAVLYPVYKSTYERADGFSEHDNTPIAIRDHVFQWSKDLGRTIDYVETRGDLDSTKIALYGFSWGAELAPILMAVEERIKAGIMLSGGFVLQHLLPEVDHINFASRARQPMLMVNGRYDYIFPFDSSQIPMFERLGSPPKDKRHAVFEGGHRPTGDLVMKEILEWLDRYLGPVG